MKTFTLTEEHLKLLSSMYVMWEEEAPIISQKRPYGNSDIELEIKEILNNTKYRDTDLTKEEIKQYKKLHRETETALQIVLSTRSFVPGVYQADKYSKNWRLINNV